MKTFRKTMFDGIPARRQGTEAPSHQRMLAAGRRPYRKDALGDAEVPTAHFDDRQFDVRVEGGEIRAYLTKPGTTGRPIMARFDATFHTVRKDGDTWNIFAKTPDGGVTIVAKNYAPKSKQAVADHLRISRLVTEAQLKSMNAAARQRHGRA